MHDPKRPTPGIWSLLAAGNDNLGVSPVDLTWFHGRFDAKPIGRDWHPLPLELVNKSKKLRDFVAWIDSAPLVSQRARDAIDALCPGAAEFLPFHALKGKPYFAMNVLQTLDVLDFEASDVLRDARTGEVLCVHECAFMAGLPDSLPPLFKDSRLPTDIFATARFARMAIEHGLTGLALADPAVAPLKKIVRGMPLNVYPGIIT